MRALLVLTLLAAAGCIRPREAASSYCGEPPAVGGSAIAWERTRGSTIEGLVTDVLGKPLSGAVVQLSGRGFGVVTDNDGRFRMERIPARDYRILVRAIEYVKSERSISLGSDEGARVLAILERAPSGIIYDCFFPARPR